MIAYNNAMMAFLITQIATYHSNLILQARGGPAKVFSADLILY